MFRDGQLPRVEIISEEEIKFAGSAQGLEKFFKLMRRRVKIGEGEDDRIFWKRGEFVFIVAVTQENRVVVIREYKQAVGKALLCLPAGSIRKGEDPTKTALRELEEETGYAVGENGQCYEFGPFFNSPDKSTELHYVILATMVRRQKKPVPDPSETILGVHLFKFCEAKKKISIGMNLMALMIAENFLRKLNFE